MAREREFFFRKRGFTPRFVEYVEDPVTGSVVVVMADPHSRRSAYIYDPFEQKII
ncbi:MAG: hypothetical protein QXY84_00815 [Candidatus Caldarchaeum sp.]